LWKGGVSDYFHIRLVVQLVFVSLLVAGHGHRSAATSSSPDEITLPGTAVRSGDVHRAIGNLQFVPVWVDFNHPMTHVYGPTFPNGCKQNHHIQGLAFSLAGIARPGQV
jgi:hypothetical protein